MAESTFWQGVVESLGRIARSGLRAAERQQRASSRRRRATAKETRAPKLSRRYPGDHRGPVSITYAPHAGTLPDPGEVVWAWIPFEEDHTQGKDRPALIVAREADWLLGLPLTSQDHDLDKRQEASQGRYWVEIGSGAWDKSGRVSEARVDRVVRIHPDDVRRVGATLDKARFDRVAAALRRHWND